MKKIWNWIKNIFKPERQDPHLVMYEEVKNLKKQKNGSVEHILDINKSCPICKELAGEV